MEIIQKENISIITPLSPKLDKRKTLRLAEIIISSKNEVALNLNNVSDCTIDFIEELKKLSSLKKFGIYNIPSDIFTIFNIMNIDKILPLYTSELDFEEKSRQLINRKFSLT